MRNLKLAIKLIAVFALGCLIGDIFKGVGLLWLIFFGSVAVAFGAAYTALALLFPEPPEVEEPPQPQPARGVQPVRPSWFARTYESLMAGLGVVGERLLAALGVVAEHGLAAAETRPAFYTGWAFVLAALISVLGGMLSWWTLWKGFHVAGVFALIATWCFIQAYDAWDDTMSFLVENKVGAWLALSAIGALVSLIHLQKWGGWPLAICTISTILAGITVCEGWGKVGELATKVFFGSGAWSVVAVSALVGILPILLAWSGIRIPVGTLQLMAAATVISTITCASALVYIFIKRR